MKKKLFSIDKIRKFWGTGTPLIHKGKKYRVGRMSYGSFFLEPADYKGRETDPFPEGTLWLKRSKKKEEKGFFEIDELWRGSSLI